MGFNLPAVQRMFGIREPISGFLTSATLVPDGEPHSLDGAIQPMAEPELAIHIGAEVGADSGRTVAEDAIAALGPAIEVADVDQACTDLTEIVATNVFHRAARLGAAVPGASIASVVARVTLNGDALGKPALESTLDPIEIVRLIARTIGAGDELLRPGDVIIAGTLLPPPVVSPGDELALDLGPLGSLSLAFVS